MKFSNKCCADARSVPSSPTKNDTRVAERACLELWYRALVGAEALTAEVHFEEKHLKFTLQAGETTLAWFVKKDDTHRIALAPVVFSQWVEEVRVWKAKLGARLHVRSLEGRRSSRRPCSIVAGCASPAALWPSPCSLVAGCAGSYAGAHLGRVRGCTCAVSGEGALAVALLARRRLRWLLRWRAPL